MSTPPRPLIVVSNRLPVSLRVEGGAWTARRSSGGLATALAGVQTDDGCWVGWPGCPVPEELRDEVSLRLAADGIVPVFLGEKEERLFYKGFCNTVLWPLLHYFTGAVDFVEEEWTAYQRVNRRFAAAVMEQAPRGARVWIHDFHLMLLPALLRAERPDLEIGFFLHIPFPSSEIYRLLPRREELLFGILGADYVSFHTDDYQRHFRSTCLRVLGVDGEHDRIHVGRRSVRIGVDPIGIDVTGFRRALDTDAMTEAYRTLEQRYRGRRLLVGVERLDYTKGVLLKLRAFERFLAADPEHARRVTLLQILIPSRLDHPEYQQLRREIEEAVGHINGTYGAPGITPVDYMHRTVTPAELAALYRRADACLVTPLRDGMNLVAQEFIYCQGAPHPELPAARGSLILSEFAGAARLLPRALLVNPWDIEQVAAAIQRALDMPEVSRHDRIIPMAQRIEENGCEPWAQHFLAALEQAAAHNYRVAHAVRLRTEDADDIIARWRDATHRNLFLDYDGTLRELEATPEEARPSPEILALLDSLARPPDTEVHLVSGRPREVLEAWFGDRPVHLCAEHGYAFRGVEGDWQEVQGVDLSWMERIRVTLEETTRGVPGSRLEIKHCALAWHYRLADPDYGSWRARELLALLESELVNLPAEVLMGHRVIEVRAAGVHKGRYVTAQLAQAPSGSLPMAIGDDRTDLDMYQALPSHGIPLHVGGAAEFSPFWVENPSALREFLTSLARQKQPTTC